MPSSPGRPVRQHALWQRLGGQHLHEGASYDVQRLAAHVEEAALLRVSAAIREAAARRLTTAAYELWLNVGEDEDAARG